MFEILAMMRKIRVILVLTLFSALVLGLVTAGCSSDSEQGVNLGNLAPDFHLEDLDGQAVSLEDLRGSPVLINFWGTWCPPCRDEMPYIQEVHEEWSDKGLMILAVHLGSDLSEVKDFTQEYNLTFTILLDAEREVALKYGIQYTPTTFFLDKDGRIQDKIIGAFQSKAHIESSLSKIMP